MLPADPGVSRAEFGSSRERSKKLTRVPAGGAATQSFTPELQWRRADRTDAADRVHGMTKRSQKGEETQSLDAETQSERRRNAVYVMDPIQPRKKPSAILVRG